MKNIFALISIITISILFMKCKDDSLPGNSFVDTLAYSYKHYNLGGNCENQDTGCVKIIIDFPVIEEIDRIDVSRINDTINEFVLSAIFEDEQFDSVFTLYNYFKKNYDSVREEFPDYNHQWFVHRNVEVNFNQNSFLSIGMEESMFTGGAHPVSFIYYVNYSTDTLKCLSIHDIVDSKYMDELNILGEKQLRSLYNIKENEPLDSAGFWFPDNEFTLNDNFTIKQNGINFYFNSYEIAPYAFGSTAITLPYSEIEHMLNDEFKSKMNL
ncbi:MAG: DUF3298 and DUF4163 domain-containing protein [Melioribacteraceae bacterium]|nr:DUF3298 and DUF4163 domain-containing protein [Melioribacteraceae bacterium]MCF8356845.1 DUF3298 and DUF4163 domain-containing protein [Melioribacteraceae bacterium]MCF8396224.1 DUF3298 and DUF4163 domain-containing protein [Melioribacteraceae bacterium]MCF8421147.1 DUF3298 and DUF4163 domain-containing protein [Melioribacteraceae bacterium]